MTQPTPPPITLDDLKHLFDLAVDTPLVCSGNFDTDDVDVLRRVAVMIGVDPNGITPDEFISQYPHPHVRRKVNPNPFPVDTGNPGPGGRGWRKETPDEVAARNVEEAADETCQAGTYGRRCGRLTTDLIHQVPVVPS